MKLKSYVVSSLPTFLMSKPVEIDIALECNLDVVMCSNLRICVSCLFFTVRDIYHRLGKNTTSKSGKVSQKKKIKVFKLFPIVNIMLRPK